jgi:hypothetical protein
MKTLLFILSFILLVGCKKSDSLLEPSGNDNIFPNSLIKLTLKDSTYYSPTSEWNYHWKLENINPDTLWLYSIRIKIFSTDSDGVYVPREQGFCYWQDFQNNPGSMYPEPFVLLLSSLDINPLANPAYYGALFSTVGRWGNDIFYGDYKMEIYGRWCKQNMSLSSADPQTLIYTWSR